MLLSKFFLTPIGCSLNAFHDLAAQRRDGLHPALKEALSKSGTVSGPPRKKDQNADNIIQGSFGSTAGGSVTGRQAEK